MKTLAPARQLTRLVLALCWLGLSATAQNYPVFVASTPQNKPLAQPIKALLADFDSDGQADLVTIGYPNGDTSGLLYLEVYLSNGDGTFASSPSASVVMDQCSEIHGFTAYGRDSTGSLNLAVLCHNTLHIWRVTHDALSLSSPISLNDDAAHRQIIQLPSPAVAMTVGDFTGAGAPGIAVLEVGTTDTHSRYIEIYPSLAPCGTSCTTSSFTKLGPVVAAIDASEDVGADDAGVALATALIPPNKNPAVVLLAPSTDQVCGGTLATYWNDGFNPQFIAGDFQPIPEGYCAHAMAADDLNNDGYTDIVLAGVAQAQPGNAPTGFIAVSMGSSDAVMGEVDVQPYDTAPMPASSDELSLVDLNNDGSADLVVGAPYPNGTTGTSETVTIYYGNGDGSFGNFATAGVDLGPINSSWAATGVKAVAVGNVNLDGSPDILMLDQIGDGNGGGVGTVSTLPGTLLQAAGSRITTTTTTLTTKTGSNGKLNLSVSVSPKAATGATQLFDATTQMWVRSASLNNGKSSYSLSVQGTHYFVACYGGTAPYLGSCSVPFAGVPPKANVTSQIDVEPTSAVPGQTITFTDTLLASSSTPTGTVTFIDNNTGSTLTSATVDSGGVATASLNTLPVGQYDVVAKYSGDAVYNANTSVDIPLAVAIPLVPVTQTLTSSASVVKYPGTLTLQSSIVTHDGTLPTGSLLFQVGGLTVAAVPITSHTVSATITPPVGTFEVRAVYAGAPGYAASMSNTLPLSVHGGLLQFVPGGAVTIAGIPEDDNHGGYGGDGAAATSARLNSPYGVTTDLLGNTYVADELNQIIRKITPDGIISTVVGVQHAGFPSPARFGGDGGLAINAYLSNPTAVAVDPAGNLFIADYSNDVVRRVDAVTGIITSYAGMGQNGGYNGDSGTATAMKLDFPSALALDASGNLYIADTGNNLVRKVDTAGNMTVYAGNYYGSFSGSNTQAQNTTLRSPRGVAVDQAGNIYISDTGDNFIYRGDAAGNITKIAGASGYAAANDGGPALSAGLNGPQALTLDLAGSLYFADNGNNSIRKIDASGTINTVAGLTGTSGTNYYHYDPQGAPATTMTLVSPSGVSIDPSGSLLLTDTYNQTVMRVGPQGALVFGPQASGLFNPAQTLTVYNAGDQPINFNATPYTLTGDYTVAPGGTSPCNFSAGLAVGASCTLVVNYLASGGAAGGSITFASSASGSTVVNLNTNPNPPASTTIFEVGDPAPYFGDSELLFAQVTSDASVPPATGTITFFDGTTNLGTQPIASGYAYIYNSTLSIGSHNLTASYNGDAYHAPSTSDVTTVNVQPYQTTTTLSASDLNPSAGTAVTFTATVTATTAGTPPSGGTVAFFDGSTKIGTAAVNGSDVATFTTASLSGGVSHSITAVYSGAGSYGSSTSSAVSVTVSGSGGGGGGGGGGGTPGFDYVLNSFGIPTTIHRGDASQGLGVTVISAGTDAGSVALACGTLPKYATCSFSPSTVNAQPNANTSVSWTITTTPVP